MNDSHNMSCMVCVQSILSWPKLFVFYLWKYKMHAINLNDWFVGNIDLHVKIQLILYHIALTGHKKRNPILLGEP